MEKSSGKSEKTRFFYQHTNMVTKKWGKKTREIIFPETHEYREKKRWKEIVWKKSENTFFINTRIS